jgi:hypothetical protein
MTRNRPVPLLARGAPDTVNPFTREYSMTEISRSWQPPEDALCAKCGERPPGPGGVLCPDCKQAIEDRVYPQQARGDGEGDQR